MKKQLMHYIGEGELSVLVKFNYYEGRPAKTAAPIEDCYPAEDDEIEIEGVFAGPKFNQEILVDARGDRMLSDKTIEILTDACWEKVQSDCAAYQDQKAEYYNDLWRER